MIVQRMPVSTDRFTGNPFSTRHTRPGQIIPLDSRGLPRDTAALLERLAALGGRGAIRGPHGSGKTTLLEYLARGLASRGASVARLRLRSWHDSPLAAVRDIAGALKAIVVCPADGTVCIDSWEQMGSPAAAFAMLLARAKGCGLLVTTHHETRLPLLAICDTTPALLASIVRRLPGSDHWADGLIAAEDIDSAYSKCAGNVREALYELYDRFEERTKER